MRLNKKKITSTGIIVYTAYILLICVIIAVSSNAALSADSQNRDYGSKNYLSISLDIINNFTIIAKSADARMDYVNMSLSINPYTDYRQKLLVVVPDIIHDGKANIYLERPEINTYSFKIHTEFTTDYLFPVINKKIPFPINGLGPEYYSYLQPTPIIDITPDIKNAAFSLVNGEDDLYIVEYKVADYVRQNVAYDLSSLTANVDQKSSWVLANKKGVCDEITNLFISMNRALGIPVRFVSGVAYTNLDIFGSSWVPHAWAEVYFPDIGWVPYDVTYGEFGYIDSGHIKLYDSYDGGGLSTKYDYSGQDIDILPMQLELDAKVQDFGRNVPTNYYFDVSLLKEEIGFDSYDVVIIDVQNNKNYYQVADIYLGDTENVNILEGTTETVLNKSLHRKEVLLSPFKKSRIYWIIKLSGKFDNNYLYTFPITVYNNLNYSKTAYMKSGRDFVMIDKDQVESFVKESSTDLPYSKNVNLDCMSDDNEIYVGSNVTVSCILDNRGDKSFNKVDICIDDNCTSRSFGIEKIHLDFLQRFDTVGVKNILIKASNYDFTKTSFVTVNVLDMPNIEIRNITYPDVVDYNDAFEIKFTLHRTSHSIPGNVSITVIGPISRNDWYFDGLDEDRVFTIKNIGKNMKTDDNNYTLDVKYSDGKYSYEKTSSFVIVNKATFIEKLSLWFNQLAFWIENL